MGGISSLISRAGGHMEVGLVRGNERYIWGSSRPGDGAHDVRVHTIQRGRTGIGGAEEGAGRRRISTGTTRPSEEAAAG